MTRRRSAHRSGTTDGRHRRRARAAPFTIGSEVVEPGTRRRLDLPVSRLPTGTWLSLPIAVVHGVRKGPVLFTSAAIHGDEIVGVEITRRVLAAVHPHRMAGTLLAVPIVNVFGFIGQDRYLPDRRDLNRCFPGTPQGSLASRLAHLFMEQIVRRADYGIDLHSAATARTNLPQIRADLEDDAVRQVAEAFGAPVLLHLKARADTLRAAATAEGRPTILFEGGEAGRFEVPAVDVGTRGVLRVMSALRMGSFGVRSRRRKHFVGRRTRWIRARRSGICRLTVGLGSYVERGHRVGVIADTFGDNAFPITATLTGIVVGMTTTPLVHRGEAIVHVAEGEEEPRPASVKIDVGARRS